MQHFLMFTLILLPLMMLLFIRGFSKFTSIMFLVFFKMVDWLVLTYLSSPNLHNVILLKYYDFLDCTSSVFSSHKTNLMQSVWSTTRSSVTIVGGSPIMKYGYLFSFFMKILTFKSTVVQISACKACSTVHRWSFMLKLKSNSYLFGSSISVSLSDVYSFVVEESLSLWSLALTFIGLFLS